MDDAEEKVSELKTNLDKMKEKKKEFDRKGRVMNGRLSDAHTTIALVSKQLQSCEQREAELLPKIESYQQEIEQLKAQLGKQSGQTQSTLPQARVGGYHRQGWVGDHNSQTEAESKRKQKAKGAARWRI